MVFVLSVSEKMSFESNNIEQTNFKLIFVNLKSPSGEKVVLDFVL